MQNDTILLEVKNLNKTFPVKKEKLYAVSDVSFSLKKGECLGKALRMNGIKCGLS